MRVERINKILLAPNLSAEEAKIVAEQEGCTGYYLIIPPSMMGKVTAETIYPYVVTEVSEDIIDE